jgi:hypothetical protein
MNTISKCFEVLNESRSVKGDHYNPLIDYNWKDVETVYNLLKDAYLLEAASTNNEKKAYQAAKKMLSSKHLDSRPILKKAYIRDGFQLFTDSYTLYKFNGEMIIKTLETHPSDLQQQYPQIDRIVDFIANYELTLNTSDLIQRCKLLKSDECLEIKTADFSIWFEKNRMLQFIDIMRLSGDFTAEVKSNVSPLRVRKNESIGIILPIRKD